MADERKKYPALPKLVIPPKGIAEQTPFLQEFQKIWAKQVAQQEGRMLRPWEVAPPDKDFESAIEAYTQGVELATAPLRGLEAYSRGFGGATLNVGEILKTPIITKEGREKIRRLLTSPEAQKEAEEKYEAAPWYEQMLLAAPGDLPLLLIPGAKPTRAMLAPLAAKTARGVGAKEALKVMGARAGRAALAPLESIETGTAIAFRGIGKGVSRPFVALKRALDEKGMEKARPMILDILRRAEAGEAVASKELLQVKRLTNRGVYTNLQQTIEGIAKERARTTPQHRGLERLIKEATIVRVDKDHPNYWLAKKAGGAYYDETTNEIFVTPRPSKKNIILHELSHSIRQTEKFPQEVSDAFAEEFKRWSRTKAGKRALEPRYFTKDADEIMADIFKRAASGKEHPKFPKTTAAVNKWLGELDMGAAKALPKVAGAAPPVKPPVPPGVVAGAPEPNQSPLARAIEAYKTANPKEMSAHIEALRKAETAKRIAKASEILQRGAERGEGRKAFVKGTGALKDKLPTEPYAPIADVLTPEDIQWFYTEAALTKKIPQSAGFLRFHVYDILDKFLSQGEYAGRYIPLTRRELEEFAIVFGDDILKAALAKRSMGRKAWEAFIETINIPKSWMASMDLSAFMRQGAILSVSHPTLVPKQFKEMVKAFAREDFGRAQDTALRARPNYLQAIDDGLWMPNIYQTKLSLVEAPEEFVRRQGIKLPLVRQSERAFVAFGNKQRLDLYDYYIAKAEQAGHKLGKGERQMIAKYLNYVTGRGNVGKLGDVALFLNAAFFSPRYVASRFQLPLLAFGVFNKYPFIRRQIQRDLATWAGTTFATAYTLKQSGLADVELDPRSGDFLKIRVGNIRLDPWAGYQQIFRTFVQAGGWFYSAWVDPAWGNVKTQTGREMQRPAWSIMMRFIEQKTSPVTGIIKALATGRTFLGDELVQGDIRLLWRKLGKVKSTADFEIAVKDDPVWSAMKEYMAPMAIRDLVESIQDEGFAKGAMIGGIPGILGVGVTVYDASANVVTEFRGALSDYQNKLQRARDLQEKGFTEDLTKYVKKFPEPGFGIDKTGKLVSTTYSYLASVERQVKKLENLRDEILYSPEYKPSEHNEYVDTINRQIIDLVAVIMMQLQEIEMAAKIRATHK